MTYLSDSEVDQSHQAESSHTPRHPPSRYPSPLPSPNLYATLPAQGTKYAPKTFTGRPLELRRFLQYFERTCQRHNITSSVDKYNGLLQYCSDKVLDTLDNLGSSETQDYDQLLDELQYFYGKNEAAYSVGKVEAFTAKWRERKISSIDQFKRYHRKYLELVGEAKKSSQISSWDYHRYFWEGLPESFRTKVEYRMLATDPSLDVSVPFKITKIVKAAEYLLSPNRFDKHLVTRTTLLSSDTEPEQEPRARRAKPSRIPASESDSDDDTKPLFKRKLADLDPPVVPRLPKKSTSKKPHHSRVDDENISELARRLGDISLSNSEYAGLYVKAVSLDPNFKDAFETPRDRAARLAQRPSNRFQRPPFPQQPFPPSGPGPSSGDMHCFGCGKIGHHIRRCNEINDLIQQGVIARESYSGKLTWPDGARIYRSGDETWVQAINSTRQVNLLQIGRDYRDTDSVYNYLGVCREDDDASTEDQADLGWTSGEVCNRQAFGAERAPRVSRDTRKLVQINPPNAAQGVKKFPRGANGQTPGRPQAPIHNHGQFNSNQAGPSKRSAPVDINQHKFEGKGDNQFLPMMVDEDVASKPANNPGKKPAHQDRTGVTKVPNPRAEKGRDTSVIAQDILDSPLTLSVREAVRISPKLRRDLATAAKGEHEPSSQIQEKTGFAGGIDYGGETSDLEVCDDQGLETYDTPVVMDRNRACA